MIITPKVRGFICTTTHPLGCIHNVTNQIEYIKSKQNKKKFKNILLIGASTGYGLSSRIALAFGHNAKTFGVFFDREGTKMKTGTPGYYNNLAVEHFAKKDNLYAKSYNGDAFTNETKNNVIKILKNDNFGKIDLIIYSIAAPKRIDPYNGMLYKAVLKPINKSFNSKTLDTDTGQIKNIHIACASDQEIHNTIKVMGGEDWQIWIDYLMNNNLLSEKVLTLAYSYIGPKNTWPIYRDGTIGEAKKHLEKTTININKLFKKYGLKGKALISINKALVTQASAAIPVVPLYISFLYKIMKENKTHENSIQQMFRLFNQKLDQQSSLDNIINLDEYEMDEKIQALIESQWDKVSSKNLLQNTDFIGYKKDFLRNFGFEWDNIDYNVDITENQLINPFVNQS